jgi:hypothetical protein
MSFYSRLSENRCLKIWNFSFSLGKIIEIGCWNMPCHAVEEKIGLSEYLRGENFMFCNLIRIYGSIQWVYDFVFL